MCVPIRITDKQPTIYNILHTKDSGTRLIKQVNE